MRTVDYEQSAKYQLMAERLNRKPIDVITDAREAGTSYRLIAIELTQKTGVDITPQQVHRWHQWRLAQPAA